MGFRALGFAGLGFRVYGIEAVGVGWWFLVGGLGRVVGCKYRVLPSLGVYKDHKS